MKINTGDTFEYFGRKYVADKVVTDSGGHIELSGHEATPVTGYTGTCFYHPFGSSETKIFEFGEIKLDPDVLTTFDWAYAKHDSKYRIRKIQINPAKNATTVIFEDGKVVVLRKHEGDPDVDLASVVAYAIAEKAYGSNTAFKKHIKNCKIELINGNEVVL